MRVQFDGGGASVKVEDDGENCQVFCGLRCFVIEPVKKHWCNLYVSGASPSVCLFISVYRVLGIDAVFLQHFC